MDITNQYSIYVGTIRGALAYTQCKPDENVRYELEGGENSEITALDWGRSENEIIVGYRNGTVKLYSILNNKYAKKLNDLEGEGPVAGIGTIEKNVLVARRSGHVNIWSKMSVDTFSINLQDDSTLECMVQNSNNSNIVGVGGERNDLKLWDIEMKKPTFKAKSLGHDELNLPIPTSVRGICFLNETNLVSCATKEGHVLLYDDRAQRRPVTKFLEPKASYSAIATAYRERQCVVGTTKGYIQLVDMRSPSKCVRTYKSFTGAVTSLVCDSFSPVVLSTSLDRFLRIHNLDTKECLYKKYMKQSLTKVIMKPIVKEEPVEEIKDENEEEKVDTEYEAMFESMKTVGEKLKKRKKIIKDDQVEKPHKKKKKKIVE